jgi:hypothetical protein
MRLWLRRARRLFFQFAKFSFNSIQAVNKIPKALVISSLISPPHQPFGRKAEDEHEDPNFHGASEREALEPTS